MSAASNASSRPSSLFKGPSLPLACLPVFSPAFAAAWTAMPPARAPELLSAKLFAAEAEASLRLPMGFSLAASPEALEGPPQGTTETTASERSFSATESCEPLPEPSSAASCSTWAFLPGEQDYAAASPVQLAFLSKKSGLDATKAGEWGAPRGSSADTVSRASEDEALTAQLQQLDLGSSEELAGAESKGSDGRPPSQVLQGRELLHLHASPPLPRPAPDERGGAPGEGPQECASSELPLTTAPQRGPLLQGAPPPTSHRKPHEAPRGRRRQGPPRGPSAPPRPGNKTRTGDSSDQLGRLGKVRSCWELWQEMMNTEGKSFALLGSSLKPNAVSYGCILDALVSNGALDLALKLLAEMKASNQAIRPNTVMYSTLIKGCAQSKQAGGRLLDQALVLFEEMAAQGVEVNTVTYNSLLDVCARVGAMDRAAMLLDDMLKKGIKPDLITFSTIIKGYCAHGQMDKGLLLLKAMRQKNINPDGVLYNSLLDGCVRAGRSSLCLELWREMQAQRIKPSNFTLSILIKLHGRMRQLQVAFDLVKQLPKLYDFKLNAHVYTCLMAACIENRQYRAAYNVLQSMRRDGVAADSKTISTIVFGCLKGRMHAQAVEVVLNALEGLRHANSHGPGSQPQRGRPGGGSSSSRRQNLPAIDEKTVRLLAHHLRDQHMHQECSLVLNTAVDVGLMSRAAAQALLASEGLSEKKHLLASNPQRAPPHGLMPPPRPHAALNRQRLRASHQQGAPSRWQDVGGGPRCSNPVLMRETASHTAASEQQQQQEQQEDGGRRQQAADTTGKGGSYLTFTSATHGCLQENQSNAAEAPWLEARAQRPPQAGPAAAALPYQQLQQEAAARRGPLAGHAVEQQHLLCTSDSLAPPAPHPKAGDAAFYAGGAAAAAAAATASPAVLYGSVTPPCPSNPQGPLPPACSAEDGVIPPQLPSFQRTEKPALARAVFVSFQAVDSVPQIHTSFLTGSKRRLHLTFWLGLHEPRMRSCDWCSCCFRLDAAARVRRSDFKPGLQQPPGAPTGGPPKGRAFGDSAVRAACFGDAFCRGKWAPRGGRRLQPRRRLPPSWLAALLANVFLRKRTSNVLHSGLLVSVNPTPMHACMGNGARK
ncbi:hypothetical protein Efla_005008 [Eimeria flavescens]